MKTRSNLPEIGDKVRYVGGLKAHWLDQDELNVSKVGLPYIRINDEENHTWVPVHDVTVMRERDEADLDEAMEEESRLKDAKDRLWALVEGTSIDGLSDRPELVRFLGDAKRIVGTWNAG